MRRTDALPRSIYLHVPFCTRRCSYCDFAVQAVTHAPVAEWIEAVTAELDLLVREREWSLPLEVDTIYVGGGTPSLLGPAAMSDLAARLRGVLDWDPDEVEWTCEANPESFGTEVAEGWLRAGVNRLSLGVQSFHGPTLRWMGRLHGPEGADLAVRNARAAGFDDISLDLIFGLPDHLDRDWGADLARVLDLEPEHISLYGLTAETGAPLGRWIAQGRERLADEDRYADEFLLAHDRLVGAGFHHYEVSNFARAGRESRHNRRYWTGSPYLALGPGAHAFFPPVRRWNTRSWDAYREAVGEGRLPLAGAETVEPEDGELEAIWLGLRTADGYALAPSEIGRRRSAEEWVRLGWATFDGDVVRLTPEGWLRLDPLATELALADSRAMATRMRQAWSASAPG